MSNTTQYACSVLEIKAIDESGGKRLLKGVATTPTPDRSGDIVMPDGAEFKLPMPLLHQHDSREPIGWVRVARVTAKGIEVECEIATINEPGKLKDRIDEVWQMLRARLVGGLSIGFKPLESARIGDSYSYKYLRWLWLELSTVVIPANSDCGISQIRSLDLIQRAASIAGELDSAGAFLEKALAIHMGHMDGTIEPDARSMAQEMTLLKQSHNALSGGKAIKSVASSMQDASDTLKKAMTIHQGQMDGSMPMDMPTHQMKKGHMAGALKKMTGADMPMKSIRSLDITQRAASGALRGGVVRLDGHPPNSPPGVSGTPSKPAFKRVFLRPERNPK